MTKQDLKIVFMGTPDFAVPALRTLVEGGYRVVGVVTQPDKPVGRHQSSVQASAVKQYAVEQGIPVLQPEKMKDERFLEALRSWEADVQVVVAFRMLPEVVWSMPRFGTFNVHAALLPQYRGAAPINWAVIRGETQTGVTTFFLDKDIDTGRIIAKRTFDIPYTANAAYVYEGLMLLGAELCRDTVDLILKHGAEVPSVPQSELISSADTVLYAAPKLFKDTCRVDWTQDMRQVYNFVRGLSPYPAAWTELSDGKTLKIYAVAETERSRGMQPVGSIEVDGGRLFVACADGWLELLDVQLSGKKRMPAGSLLNGFRAISALTMR